MDDPETTAGPEQLDQPSDITIEPAPIATDEPVVTEEPVSTDMPVASADPEPSTTEPPPTTTEPPPTTTEPPPTTLAPIDVEEAKNARLAPEDFEALKAQVTEKLLAGLDTIREAVRDEVVNKLDAIENAALQGSRDATALGDRLTTLELKLRHML